MKTKIIIGVFCIVSLASLSFTLLNKTGKAGFTGSPGEQSCNNCHNSFALNSGDGSVRLETNIPNDHYMPDSVYEISVIVSKPGVGLFGFGLEALDGDELNAGTFTVTDGLRMQQLTAPNGRKNMTHKLNGGASTDSAVFTFNWKAPSEAIGDITFYFTGVCANNNNSNNQDYVYRSNHTISQSPTLSISDQKEDVSSLMIRPFPNGQLVEVGFYLHEMSDVSMSIITLDGKVVGTQDHKLQSQGEKSYTFLTDHLNGGVYIFQAIVNGKGFTKKFFLVK